MNLKNGLMSEKGSTWFRGWKRWLIVYLLLLACSHFWRTLEPDTVDLESNEHSVTVNQVVGDSVLHNQPLRMVYRDTYQGEKENPPVVLLLNGSPIGTTMFPQFIDRLSRENRVIAPHFPGYEASSREIPDYSMRAYSLYMNQMLDSLNIEKVHVVGYSLGAGVGIKMSHFYPDKVASIGMISGLGVQELELLGSYHLNHAIYGGQLFFTWLLHEMVPHFGLLRDFPVHVPYARSFYDSDQRPIRKYLKEYKKPMLIQHGREDGLTPLAAAQEHHRLVPQSKLILYDGDHTIVEDKTQKLVEDINSFIQRVESGKARTYAEASRQRILESQKPFEEINFAKVEGLTLFILMLIIIISSFVSEDLACIGAGLLAARGIIGFWSATVACFLGIIIGDFAVFMIGRWLGKPAIRRAPIKWFVNEKELENSAEWFNVRGPMIIIGSRFIPGSRFPIYFSAGMIGMNFFIFAIYFLAAGAVWTPGLVGLSMLVGTELLRWFQTYQEFAILVIPAIILLLFLFVKFVLPAVTWRGRRLVVSRWRRITRWEYWPAWMIYTPLVCYIGFLWIKYGKLTAFTAANPAIRDGGFIGESKSEILQQFQKSGCVPRYITLEAELNDWEKFVTARDHILDQDWDYPVVLKPDAGQRGEGVCFSRNEEELKGHLEGKNYKLIMQKYIGGQEYGVFYYRYPSEKSGHILSITRKELPTLTGDGESTLEELILKDNDAVTMAKHHFKIHRDHLFDIPGKGEEIQLVKVGTHSRGARFSDASHLATPQLESRIDEVAQCAEGFFFGRLDVKVPSEEELNAGENLKILEVNGVTSETTSIYDSKYSFFDAQKKLMQQWRIAYEIGDQNRAKGQEVPSPIELIRKLLNYKSK
ncbi:MAG: alpha/beta fold hydrolase [Balneolaceae bacterium]|nr:alpha/beta fold hydrolase [Balneolaceae bacterium]